MDNEQQQPRHDRADLTQVATGAGVPAEGRATAPAGFDIARLFRSERARLVLAVRRRVADPEEAADLIQDAFERLAQVDPFVPLRTPAAYLQRIVRNLLRDRAKRAEQRYAFCDLVTAEADIPTRLPEQEWAIEADDLMDQYVSALATLSPRCREVFLLHRVEELRYRDIAEQLGISVATVEYHMARALVQLDKAINQ